MYKVLAKFPAPHKKRSRGHTYPDHGRNFQNSAIRKNPSQVLAAHACNPSYLGGSKFKVSSSK
jgi:hypothetical protein